MNPRNIPLASLALALLFAIGAHADTVHLRDGEKLVGRLVTEAPDTIIFESRTLGRVEIPRARIERLERELPAAPAFQPPVALQAWAAGPTHFDWIQLKSGEWLKGEIKSLQDERLEFNSEELDLLSFDWDKIAVLRSGQLFSVRLEQLKPVDGLVVVTSNEVQIVATTTTNVFPRSELLGLAPTGNREVDKWTGKISVGFSYRAGNTRETDLSVFTSIQRRTPDTRLSLDYSGNYSRVNGTEVEQNHRLDGQFDYFLSRRLFLRVPDVEYYRDPLQNLDHRLTLGAGVGYDFIKTPRTEWNVTVTPAWQRNWFNSVETGQRTVADSAALVLSSRFETELTQRLDYILEYRGQLSRQATGNDTHYARTALEFEIHKRLKLDLSLEWNRISQPQTEASGDTPSPDDFRLVTALGVDL